MNIELSLIDQQVQGIAEKLNIQLDANTNKQASKAFLFLVLKNLIDSDEEEDILDCIYDDGNDYSIDGLYVSDVVNDSFTIKVIQTKYTRILKKNGSYYDGRGVFPRTDVIKMINTLPLILDPNKQPVNMPIRLKTKIAEIKELLQSGIIPTVEVYLAHNGLTWDDEAQSLIDNSNFPDWINFSHFNHQSIINLSRTRENINDTLNITGKAIVEDFDYARVMIAKVKVEEFFNLFQKHGDKLLEKNVRKYLGAKSNRVNEAIKNSLLKDSNSDFFFLNNGITMIVSSFTHNAMQDQDFTVRLNDIHIINGGQTCKTIEETIKDNPSFDFSKAFVLIRIYMLSKEQEKMINEITYATNSQTAINLRDLKANDDIQKSLIEDVSNLLKDDKDNSVYTYKPKRDNVVSRNNITIAVAAEAIFSIWNEKPHVVKFRKNRLFEDNYYNDIFTDKLNGAQLVLAVLIWRYVETKRKTSIDELYEDYPFIGYASNLVSMIVGILILQDKNISKNKISYINFQELKEHFEVHKDNYYISALNILKEELESERIEISLADDSLQRIAGLFRGGYLTQHIIRRLKGN